MRVMYLFIAVEIAIHSVLVKPLPKNAIEYCLVAKSVAIEPLYLHPIYTLPAGMPDEAFVPLFNESLL